MKFDMQDFLNIDDIIAMDSPNTLTVDFAKKFSRLFRIISVAKVISTMF